MPSRCYCNRKYLKFDMTSYWKTKVESMKLTQTFADCSDYLSGPLNLEAAKPSCNTDQNLALFLCIFSSRK